MSSKREQILAEIERLLKQISTVPAASVGRSRIFPDNESDCPVIWIEPVADKGNETAMSVFTHLFTFDVTVIASGEIPDQVADPITEEVTAKLMANRTLGGLCSDLTASGVDFDFEAVGGGMVAATCHFDIRYRDSK